MKAKKKLWILLLLPLLSCSSFKKEKYLDFSKDSEFLKHGYKVEEFKENEPLPAVVSKAKSNNSKVEKKKPTVKSTSKGRTKQENSAGKAGTKSKAKLESAVQGPRFIEGEYVILSASYFGVEAGKVKVGVSSMKKLNGVPVLHFYASGKSTSIFSWFYSLEDRIDVLWDPKIKKPLSLSFDVNETKQRFKTRTYFNWNTRKADYFEEGWDKKKGDYKGSKVWRLPISAQDIVSAIFYTRYLPLKLGESYSYNVFENSKVIYTTIKVDRKETIRTRKGSFKTMVIKPSFSTNGKFKKVGDIEVWVTDDEYRQIIKIESKIKIGTVVAKLYELHRPKIK